MSSRSPDILQQAAQGFRTALLSQVVRFGCKIVSVVVIARLVAPADHGLFAMAAGVTAFLFIFRDFGLGTAAVRAPELSEGQCTALLWVHVGAGVWVALMTLALAPLAAAFFEEPQVKPLLATMSLAAVLLGIGGWPRALLLRRLKFAQANGLDMIASVAGTTAMVIGGAAGAGAYSFALFLIVSEAVLNLGAWGLCGWKPVAPADWKGLLKLAGTGGEITGINVLTYALQLIDTFAVGRWFGATTLGLYSRSTQLVLLPSLHVSTPLNQVLLASLSRLGVRSPDFGRHLRETVNLIGHLTLPFVAVCVALPEDTIRLALGARWLGAAPVLRWMALNAALVAAVSVVPSLCIAAGRTRRLAAQGAVALAGMAVALWVGRDSGVTGIAAAITVANLILLAPRIGWAVAGLPVRVGDFAAGFAGPLVVSVLLGGVSAGVAHFMPDAMWAIRLSVALLAGGGVAVGAVVLSPSLKKELQNVRRHIPGVS